MADVQDDLTILSRNALLKISMKEGLGLTKDDATNLTPDELRDEIRRRRQAKGSEGLKPNEPIAPAWTLVLPAIEMHQLGRDCFASSIRYADLAKISVDREVQRPESKKRIPEIAGYVSDNDGFFASVVLTVSGAADGHIAFVDGALHIDANAKIVVNDGQHRIAGIQRAIKDGLDADRLNDDLPVIIYADLTQTEQRQLFADLNTHAAKASRAISLDYDERNALIAFAKDIVNSTSVFRGRVDFLKTKVGAKDATHVWTFATIVDAIKAQIDDRDLDATLKAELVTFWGDVFAVLGEAWYEKRGIVHLKNAMVAIARLNGFDVDFAALKALDWSVGGELDQIASSAGGTNSAIKALFDELSKRVTVSDGEKSEEA